MISDVKKNKFACFVLCHGRPHNTPTIKTLRKYGYTGNIYIICDDQDSTIIGYKNYFPDCKVEIFSKSEIAKTFDLMDNQTNDKCAVFARNACFDIAERCGLDYFCELDDDYTSMPYRYVIGGVCYRSKCSNLDAVFDAYIEFMESNSEIYSVAFGQPGDFIGGSGSYLVKHKYIQKTMNSWICKTNRRFIFNGRMNDDVNTYCIYGSRGKLFYTFNFIMIDQPETQQVKGGMTAMYSGNGTYMKSFYTVMECPSFVKIGMMGDRYYRRRMKMEKSIRVPTRIHTRWLDRLVAHKNMKRAGLRKVNKHDYSGPAYDRVRLDSYFSRHWRDTIDVPTIDVRRKKK